MRFITNPFVIGAAVGAVIRAFMAHGDIHLFLNPYFPMLVHYQPWL